MAILAVGLIGGALASSVGLSFSLGFAVFGTIAQLLLRPHPQAPTFKAASSAWGRAWPIVYNNFRVAGQLLQAGDVTGHEDKFKKGGEAYSQTFAIGFCEGVHNIGRIWADNKVIYDPRALADPPFWLAGTDYSAGDQILPSGGGKVMLVATVDGTSGGSEPTWNLAINASNTDGGQVWIAAPYVRRTTIGQQYNFTMRINTGTETQLPDSALEAMVGVGLQPGYRGLLNIVFENFDLSRYGNRIPNFEAEILDADDTTFSNTGQVYGTQGNDTPVIGQFLTDDNGNIYYASKNQQMINIKTLVATPVGAARQLTDAQSFGYPYAGMDGLLVPLAGKYFAAIQEKTADIFFDRTYEVVLYQIETDGSVTALGCKEYPTSNVDLGSFGASGLLSTGELIVAGGDFAAEDINVVVFGTIAGMTGAFVTYPFSATRGSKVTAVFGLYGAIPAPYLGYCLAFVGDTLYCTLNKAHMDWLSSHGSGVGYNAYYATLQPGHPRGTLVSISLASSGTGVLITTLNGPTSDFGWPFTDEGKNRAGATSGNARDSWSPPTQVQNVDGSVQSVYFVRGYSDTGSENLVGVNRFSATGSSTGSISATPFGIWSGSLSQPLAYFATDAIYMRWGGNTAPKYYAKIGTFIPFLMSLADICADVSQRVGLTDQDYDYSALATTFPRGCALLDRGAARDFLESMQPAFFYDLVDIGDVVKGSLRANATLSVTIPEADLGAGDGTQIIDRLSTQRGNDREIPQDLEIQFYDIQHDYLQGSMPARRSAVTQYSAGRNSLSVPVVMTPGEAANAAERTLYMTWIERNQQKVSIPLEYVGITPADFIAAVRKSINNFIRVTKATLNPSMVIDLDGVGEDLGTYSLTAQAPLADITSGVYVPQTVNPISPPVLIMMDVPPLRNQDLSETAVYAAGSVVDSGGWDGEQVMKSADGSSYSTPSNALLTQQSTLMLATSVLGDCLRWPTWDRVNTLDVKLLNGAIGSATEAACVASLETNLFFMSNGAGGGEFFQAATVTPMGGSNYRLSDFLRGRFGTESFIAGHIGGEYVVQVVESKMVDILYSNAEIGASRYWKGVNDSPTLSETPVQNLTMTTRRQMPRAPYHLKASRDMSANATITGLRRMRWRGKPLWVPLETDQPAMEIDVMNGSTVVRTITSTASGGGSVVSDPLGFTVMYTAADQVTDFGSTQASISILAYQLNAIVGRGFAGSKTV